jgi:hypothetical protein
MTLLRNCTRPLRAAVAPSTLPSRWCVPRFQQRRRLRPTVAEAVLAAPLCGNSSRSCCHNFLPYKHIHWPAFLTSAFPCVSIAGGSKRPSSHDLRLHCLACCLFNSTSVSACRDKELLAGVSIMVLSQLVCKSLCGPSCLLNLQVAYPTTTECKYFLILKRQDTLDASLTPNCSTLFQAYKPKDPLNLECLNIQSGCNVMKGTLLPIR